MIANPPVLQTARVRGGGGVKKRTVPDTGCFPCREVTACTFLSVCVCVRGRLEESKRAERGRLSRNSSAHASRARGKHTHAIHTKSPTGPIRANQRCFLCSTSPAPTWQRLTGVGSARKGSRIWDVCVSGLRRPHTSHGSHASDPYQQHRHGRLWRLMATKPSQSRVAPHVPVSHSCAMDANVHECVIITVRKTPPFTTRGDWGGRVNITKKTPTESQMESNA